MTRVGTCHVPQDAAVVASFPTIFLFSFGNGAKLQIWILKFSD